MQAEDRVRLQHILDEAREALKYTEGMSYAEFQTDGKTARAIIRSLEVIDEAASRISDRCRAECPDIVWPKMVGMRNRLIHVYFDIDYRMIWRTVRENLPPLIEQISKHLDG